MDNEHENEMTNRRCECGNLLAKYSKDTLEIKCRRCKRVHIIPLWELIEGEIIGEVRCGCGNLLNKVIWEDDEDLENAYVEIKCRRCKRLHPFPLVILLE